MTAVWILLGVVVLLGVLLLWGNLDGGPWSDYGSDEDGWRW